MFCLPDKDVSTFFFFFFLTQLSAVVDLFHLLSFVQKDLHQDVQCMRHIYLSRVTIHEGESVSL